MSLPMLQAVTSGSGVRTAPPAVQDPQTRLHLDLIAAMTRDIPSVEHMLELVVDRLAHPCGVRAASVFTLDPDDGRLLPDTTHGVPAADDLGFAGRVFRVSAGAPAVLDGTRTAIRLRVGGRTMGVLVLTGSAVAELRPDVTATVALHLAATLQMLAAEQHLRETTHATATIRRLFEEGTGAATDEDAGRLLARATGETFRTEHAAVYLIGADGRIRYASGLGISERMNTDLTRALIGRLAADSPIWRRMLAANGPVLVGDTSRTEIRPGGIARTMGLRSFIAMPLLSSSGPVGVVMCGDTRITRQWTGRDHALAQQLAVEGALIVDSARLRQAERRHVAELTRQAYHDGLTGVANRAQMLDRAAEEIEIARAGGGRLGLLLLDLDGFKRVNDTVGHHAGDSLLQAVAQRLQATVREHDVVARLGGDEFAVLLTHDPDSGTAAEIAGRLHTRLCEPYDIEGRQVHVGASIGIALLPGDADDIGALMRGADTAMYRVKRAGGGVRLLS